MSVTKPGSRKFSDKQLWTATAVTGRPATSAFRKDIGEASLLDPSPALTSCVGRHHHDYGQRSRSVASTARFIKIATDDRLRHFFTTSVSGPATIHSALTN